MDRRRVVPQYSARQNEERSRIWRSPTSYNRRCGLPCLARSLQLDVEDDAPADPKQARSVAGKRIGPGAKDPVRRAGHYLHCSRPLVPLSIPALHPGPMRDGNVLQITPASTNVRCSPSASSGTFGAGPAYGRDDQAGPGGPPSTYRQGLQGQEQSLDPLNAQERPIGKGPSRRDQEGAEQGGRVTEKAVRVLQQGATRISNAIVSRPETGEHRSSSYGRAAYAPRKPG